MRITIKNHIDIAGETELIHEVHEGELAVKGDYQYFIYRNNEGEKVILKFNSSELVMTRFSKPQSLMRFVSGKMALCSVPTPMGLQQLVTRTEELMLSQTSLKLTYDLLPNAEAEDVFASYRMMISWEN